jgi:hypothetical protein
VPRLNFVNIVRPFSNLLALNSIFVVQLHIGQAKGFNKDESFFAVMITYFLVIFVLKLKTGMYSTINYIFSTNYLFKIYIFMIYLRIKNLYNK